MFVVAKCRGGVQKGNGSPENSVTGSSANKGKMVANKDTCSFACQSGQQWCLYYVVDNMTTYVLSLLPFWASSCTQSKVQMVNRKGSMFITGLMLRVILAVSKRRCLDPQAKNVINDGWTFLEDSWLVLASATASFRVSMWQRHVQTLHAHCEKVWKLYTNMART